MRGAFVLAVLLILFGSVLLAVGVRGRGKAFLSEISKS